MGQGKFDTFNSLGSAQFKTIDYITNERNIFNGECILIQYFEYIDRTRNIRILGGINLRMEINELLLRKYIFHNQILRDHNEAVAETYLEDAYNDDEELRDDMEHTLKKSQKIREIEEELLKELNK